jgi:hypothetical protein
VSLAAGVDIGAEHTGLVVSDGSREVVATTLAGAPREVAAGVVEAVTAAGAGLVVLELGRGYVSPGATPAATAAAAIAVMACRDRMVEVAVRIFVALEGRGVRVVRVAAQTWRKALGMGKDRGDAACRLAVAGVVGEARAGALADAHQVDALGALLGVRMLESGDGAEGGAGGGKVARSRRARLEARRVGGCIGCKRRHGWPCPMAGKRGWG